ncbi:hypothetical protein KBY70_03580 [Cyanobium sp. ATX 6E8]|uniref:hypothetical protein n=1 Tax=Cyanobium sp. ATX 6E8 TaxID=2823701 RepID=UPI0020CD95B3|nr:hypothetical protein [Cyanobium sp. ATX 6E8]MCP9941485.1 hypothetical protein [Cyanobium sp. ATX 6E8]
MQRIPSMISAIRQARYFLKTGLEYQGFTLSRSLLDSSSWVASPSQHCQVISPGRSGTRWLANVLLEATNSLVCHATPKTLAEPGYLLDQCLISEDEALGAYRNSRADFLLLAEKARCSYVDLDCKVSPLARVIAKAYDKCKFLIALRNPVSFVRSGIVRGYFAEKSPCVWGHLESCEVNASLPKEEWQIYKIAAFWRSIALLSDSMLTEYPDRVYVLNTRAMFSESTELRRLLNWLDLSHSNLDACKWFGKRVNASRSARPLTPVQQSLLDSKELERYCFNSLSSKLIEMSGFSSDLG